jgi:hypothetical protein
MNFLPELNLMGEGNPTAGIAGCRTRTANTRVAICRALLTRSVTVQQD